MTTHLNTHILAYLKFYETGGVVIHGTPKPDPEFAIHEAHVWEVWQDYLASKGHAETLDFWRYHLAHGGKGLTLPCERPEEFDRFVSTQKGSKSSSKGGYTANSTPRQYKD